jgi:hypothetical protein
MHVASFSVDMYDDFGPHTWAQGRFRVDCGGSNVVWTNDVNEIGELIKQHLPGVGK